MRNLGGDSLNRYKIRLSKIEEDLEKLANYQNYLYNRVDRKDRIEDNMYNIYYIIFSLPMTMLNWKFQNIDMYKYFIVIIYLYREQQKKMKAELVTRS